MGAGKPFVGLLLFGLAGCGTYVPDLRDWPNNNNVGAVTMVHAIVRSVECELKNAVTNVVNHDVSAARQRPGHRVYTDFLNNWGAEVTFTFTIVEKSGINPAAVWMPPSPSSAVFTLAADATASSEATRVEKLNFFYTVKNLYLREGEVCDASGEDPSGSFLIKNNLKIGELLDLRIAPAVTGIATTPNSQNTISGETNVLSHEITFEVLTSGDLTPTWVLTRATINGTGNFLSASRDRTHDLVITFGPLDKPQGGKSLIAIAEQSHLNLQLATGIATNLKPAVLPR
jgi:hypothetical protein